jgi:3-oxoacyl-[acyl-carrier protein] reductase
MDTGIRGKVAAVTGGGRGLGRAMCLALAAEGAITVVWDRDAAAKELADAIEKTGGVAMALTADVTNPGEVTEAVDRVIDTHRRVDILINCAGFSNDAPLEQMTDDQWHAVIDVCLNGPFYVTRAVVPHMKAQHYGRIINISSRTHVGDVNKVNYCAAKAGLDGLTYALALELGRSGITANAIAPGYCETERTRGLTYAKEIQERALEKTYTHRLGTPEDIAAAAVYLASEQSGYLTGEVLTVAGGRWR